VEHSVHSLTQQLPSVSVTMLLALAFSVHPTGHTYGVLPFAVRFLSAHVTVASCRQSSHSSSTSLRHQHFWPPCSCTELDWCAGLLMDAYHHQHSSTRIRCATLLPCSNVYKWHGRSICFHCCVAEHTRQHC
jgi:hypothetical protein